jgi:hypothetical protein
MATPIADPNGEWIRYEELKMKVVVEKLGIVKNTVAGCQMRISLYSAPVSLGLNRSKGKVLELLAGLAAGKPRPAAARKFLREIGYYKMEVERRRLAALIKNNPGIEEREAREEAARRERDQGDCY